MATEAPPVRGPGISGILRVVLHPAHLRRTAAIALMVGVVLTAINHGDVLVAGDATGATWIKIPLNFAVPFVVANLGLLSGYTRERPP